MFPQSSVASVLAACVSTIADPDRKAGFAATGVDLTLAADEFWAALEGTSLHQLEETDEVGDMDLADMIWLYEQKMAAAKSPGRTFYDATKMAAPNGKCPLCGRGAVYSLDHHLPKTTLCGFDNYADQPRAILSRLQ
jgi:hypothetical protein